MSVILRKHTTANYYIYLELTRRYDREIYTVAVCQCYSNGCGYPIRTMTYPANEEKKAIATYKRYIKKYMEV